MMKLWVPSRSLPNSPNHYRSFLSHTLHIRYNNSLFISNTHLSRRKLRVTNPIYTRKRSLNIFYLLIPSCRTRLILWIIYIYRNLKHWSTSTVRSHSHSIYRLRPSMRTNIILRCHSYYKPPISHPIYWNNPSRMNLRGLLSRQSHLDPILRFPLHLTIIIAALAIVHLLFLHETGSNNPTGLNSDADKIPFHPYYTIKDILGILIIFLILITLVLFFPDILGDPDNYIPANPLNTPPHIKPE